jgi:hypothetical protein
MRKAVPLSVLLAAGAALLRLGALLRSTSPFLEAVSAGPGGAGARRSRRYGLYCFFS